MSVDVKKTPPLRSQLGLVRGLGSAKSGMHHWWSQRLTALALIPLSIYFLISFFSHVVFHGGYQGALLWLSSPINAVLVILLLGTGFHHGQLGLHVVIEDYIHGEKAKLTLIILTKFLAIALGLTGIVAVLRVLLGA